MHFYKKSISLFIVFILLITISIPCFADDTIYVWSSTSSPINTTNNASKENNISNNSSTNSTSNQINDDKKSQLTNAKNVSEENSLNLESQSAILIEQTTGQILYSHNIHEKLRPASVTKVMSILLIMEALDSNKISLSDAVPCSENASSMGGSQIWLDPKETLTVDEMLKAICVASANDCVVAMAEFIAGSEDSFVKMMNDKAKSLGMNDTCFKNCHGLDEDGHVTSSYDIALMSRELLTKHPQITKYTTIWMDSLRDGKSQLANTNKLIKNYKGATGLKTGSTGLALYNLSASATRDNLSLIAVIMKAPSTKVRFAEAQKLLDYGFNSFSFKTFGKKGDIVKSISVNKGVTQNLDIIFENDASCLIKKGQEKDIKQNLELVDTISAPIEKGQKIGKITYSLNDEEIASVNLIAKDNIDKINLFTMSKEIVYNWINLLR